MLTFFKDKCFKTGHFDEIEKHTSWHDARGRCTAQGGDLAMAKTLDELNIIHSYIDLTANHRCTYVGLRSIAVTPGSHQLYR